MGLVFVESESESHKHTDKKWGLRVPRKKKKRKSSFFLSHSRPWLRQFRVAKFYPNISLSNIFGIDSKLCQTIVRIKRGQGGGKGRKKIVVKRHATRQILFIHFLLPWLIDSPSQCFSPSGVTRNLLCLFADSLSLGFSSFEIIHKKI